MAADNRVQLKTLLGVAIFVDPATGKFSADYPGEQGIEYHESQSLETIEDAIVRAVTPTGRLALMFRPDASRAVSPAYQSDGETLTKHYADKKIEADEAVRVVIGYKLDRGRYSRGTVRLVTEGQAWLTHYEGRDYVLPDEELIAAWNLCVENYAANQQEWFERFQSIAARFEGLTLQELRDTLDRQAASGEFPGPRAVLAELRAARRAAA